MNAFTAFFCELQEDNVHLCIALTDLTEFLLESEMEVTEHQAQDPGFCTKLLYAIDQRVERYIIGARRGKLSKSGLQFEFVKTAMLNQEFVVT